MKKEIIVATFVQLHYVTNFLFMAKSLSTMQWQPIKSYIEQHT